MLLLDIYHITMDSLGFSIVFDLSQARIKRVLGIPLQVAVDFDLHGVGDVEDSPWVLGKH